MFFRKITMGMFVAVILLLSACASEKDNIMVYKNENGTELTMEYKKFNSEYEGDIYLKDGDTMKIETTRDSGRIALTISGRKGSIPYTGSNLDSGMFTVTVSETDEYVFRIAGKDATGKVFIENLGSVKK